MAKYEEKGVNVKNEKFLPEWAKTAALSVFLFALTKKILIYTVARVILFLYIEVKKFINFYFLSYILLFSFFPKN